MLNVKRLVILFFLLNLTSASTPTLAPVSGFAISFLSGVPISDAKVTALENGRVVFTNSAGQFGPIFWPVGQPITLILEKPGFHTTQTATVHVPPQGLTSPMNNLTFQVPSNEAFFLLKKIIGVSIDEHSCHVATTITAFNKTLNDIPQGEPNAKIVFIPHITASPFYFGIFKHWPLVGKTNPFVKGLTTTTLDGGVIIANLLPRKKPYFMTATKPGVTFTKIQFTCRPDVFINLSPPQSPHAKI